MQEIAEWSQKMSAAPTNLRFLTTANFKISGPPEHTRNDLIRSFGKHAWLLWFFLWANEGRAYQGCCSWYQMFWKRAQSVEKEGSLGQLLLPPWYRDWKNHHLRVLPWGQKCCLRFCHAPLIGWIFKKGGGQEWATKVGVCHTEEPESLQVHTGEQSVEATVVGQH